jgi:hypothetical protein
VGGGGIVKFSGDDYDVKRKYFRESRNPYFFSVEMKERVCFGEDFVYSIGSERKEAGI